MMVHTQVSEPQNKEYIQFVQTKVFGSLDGLRALSIVAVLWHHHANNIVKDWNITARGFLGVDLFFIISGFLIVTLLLRERRVAGTLSLRNFYIRRFLRILPPYYLVLVFVGAMTFVSPAGNSAGPVKHDLKYALFFVSNFVSMQSLLAITWSLSVEEQFYAVAPTLEKYARRALPFLLPLAYVLTSLPPFGVFSIELPAFFKETTFGPILLGVMLAHALDNPVGFSLIARLARPRFAAPVALCLVCLTASYPASEFVGWPRIATHWAMLALVASCVVREGNSLRPALTLWPVRRIGIVSYGMYLYHLLVMHLVVLLLSKAGSNSGSATFVFTVVGSWLVAELSYRWFETPFLSLRSRFVAPAQRSPLIDPGALTILPSLQDTEGVTSSEGH